MEKLMDVKEAIRKSMDIAIACYTSKCKLDHDPDTRNALKQKGFTIMHVTHSTIKFFEDREDVRVRVLVLHMNEYAKLYTHCPLAMECAVCTTTYVIRDVPLIVIAIVGPCITAFDTLVRSMSPYINKDLKRMTDALDVANDTIKQLRLDLKAFRSMKRKEKKKNAIPPPAYIDERPPDF
jgi:hypothetical protein